MQLFQKAIEAHNAKDYARFLELTTKAHELDPANPTHVYNMACGYALTGKKSEALKSLEEAIRLGFRDLNLMKSDSDLESIRGEQRFAQLIKYAETGEAPPVTAASVQVKVFKPDSLEEGKKYPLVVALHGYGRNPARALEHWEEAAQKVGAIAVAPQGTQQMSSSAFHWGELSESVPVVVAAVEKAVKEMPVDPDKVILTGFSQGGSLAYEAALSHPELFRGLIPVAGRYTASEGSAAGKIADKTKSKLTRAFIMVGAEDRATVLDTTKQAVKDLESAGCKVQLVTYEGVGHTYPENRVEEQVKAIKFVLGD
jgi:predicted esterase